MEIVRCSQGHYYDANNFKTCPYCQSANESDEQILHCFEAKAFTVSGILACGSSGKVYLLRKGTNRYALKVIHAVPGSDRHTHALREIHILQGLKDCPNVIKLADFVEEKTAIAILEEYAVPLQIFWKEANDAQRLEMVSGICDAVIQCHSHGVIHADLKPQNFFLAQDGRILLGDFSHSLVEGEASDLLMGTSGFIAPESLRFRNYSFSTDQYALGQTFCQLFELCSAQKAQGTNHIFCNENVYTVLRRAAHGHPSERFGSITQLKNALLSALRPAEKAYDTEKTALPTFCNAPSKKSFVKSIVHLGNLFKSPQKQQAVTQTTPQAAPNVCIGDSPAFLQLWNRTDCQLTQSSASQESMPQYSAAELWEVESAAFSTCLPDYPQSAGQYPEAANPSASSTVFAASSSTTVPAFHTYPHTAALCPAAACEMHNTPTVGFGQATLAGTPFEAAGVGAVGSVPRQSEAPSIDTVQFSAISPKAVQPGDYAMIDIVMYVEGYRSAVERILQNADGPVKETSSGYFNVARSTNIRIDLSSPDMELEDCSETNKWIGKASTFSFCVPIPEAYCKRQILFIAKVFFDDVPATRLKFVMTLNLAEATLPVERRDFHSAFVSYASQDREAILHIIQGMRRVRPDMDIFMDVLSLRCNSQWEPQLYAAICKQDLFFLCWSRNAQQSEWVDREWRYALSQKGMDVIVPIPLEPISLCAPPMELNKIHFNDMDMLLGYYSRQGI